MRTLVKSLKRLYAQNRVAKEHLRELVENRTITEEEYKFITSEDY